MRKDLWIFLVVNAPSTDDLFFLSIWSTWGICLIDTVPLNWYSLSVCHFPLNYLIPFLWFQVQQFDKSIEYLYLKFCIFLEGWQDGLDGSRWQDGLDGQDGSNKLTILLDGSAIFYSLKCLISLVKFSASDIRIIFPWDSWILLTIMI